MRKLIFALVVVCVLTLFCGSAAAATPSLGPIVVVAFENHPYSSVVGSSAMPYLNSLISKYSLATNFYAAAPGSVPDYFMLTTGNTVACCPSYTGPYTGNNLARVMINGGRSWKVYVQGIPYAGYTGTGYYPYVKYHNPFAYFSDVLNSSTQKAKIVPLTQFLPNLGALPRFSLIVPDNRHNAHDCPNGTTTCTDWDKLHAADLFLQDYIQPLLTTSQFQTAGLLVIWWDEGNSSSERTAIVLIGPKVKKGFKSSTSYKDQNLLRMIIEGMGLSSFPGASYGTYDMNDIFF